MPARLSPPVRLVSVRRSGLLRLALALLPLVGLAACSAPPPEDLSQAGLPSPRSRPDGPAAHGGRTTAPPPADLIPLPSPETVLNRVPLGRPDPFAPLPGSQPRPQPAIPQVRLPIGFRLRGVLRVAGRDQAFVQSATGSGVICLGPQGRCSAGSEPLLPKGTAVVAIQPQIGCIIVVAAGQRTRHCLQES